MDQPIILCGLGRMGWRVLEYLQAAHLPVVIVDTQCKPDDARLGGARLVPGDCRQPEVLEAAGVRRARGVLILIGDDLVNIAATLRVRALNADVRIVLRMFNQNLIGRLGKTVANVYALSTSLLTAPIVAITAMTGQGLGRFRLDTPRNEVRHVGEVTVASGSEYEGRTLEDLAGRRQVQVLANLPENQPARYLLDIDLQAKVHGGDRVVVCGAPQSVNALLSGAAGRENTDLQWATWLRRMGRVAWRTFKDIDLSVKICTGVLLGVIILSTFILHLGVEKFYFSDALFRTISLIATGADMREGDYVQNAGMKVYVSLLRLIGAALIAAFTAIVTNYLLRARLAGALEVRRIPDGGHIIVCGLGPIGFRVIEELLDSKEQVVVIETDPASRFIATARRRGAAVIIGDATIIEVLRQAHADTAKAVIAATNHDLLNLETALLVRELNSVQRVVVLQSDPQLAQMLRDAANVKLAVSVPALAAPAFVAGLFGDRVLSVFLVRDRIMAVIDLVVQPHDPFLDGQAVRVVAVDYRLQPIALLPASGSPPSQPLNAMLHAGDHLIGILTLPDLQRLLRRQPSAKHFAVDVTAFPLPTREWLAGLVRTLQKVTTEEAQSRLDRLPLRLDRDLSRGQAEDLLARLSRERITAQVRSLDVEAKP
jgi:Trk K+ transport system NAD-binding subunit